MKELKEFFKDEIAQGAAIHKKHNEIMMTKQENKEKRRADMRKKYTCKKPIYENATMLAPDGTLLCHTDFKKANWYV